MQAKARKRRTVDTAPLEKPMKHWGKLCIPLEDSLNEEQIDVFHKILDCVSETAAAEMRAAYKVGFKDGATMMQEIQD